MISLRSLAFNIAFFGWTIVLGIAALPLLLAPRATVMRFGRFWAWSVLALLRAIVGIEGEIRGLERAAGGPCLIAMKHQSTWDSLILPVILGDPAVVLKRELFWLPIYGWYARRAGSIAVDRKGGGAALRRMIAIAKTAAAMGRPIVIFPQGTRVAPGASRPYQPGVAALYQALGLPLVPAAVNSGLYWGRRSFAKRRGRIILEFLEPLPPGLPRRAMMMQLEQRIEEASATLVSEGEARYRGSPSPRDGGSAGGTQSSSPTPTICSRL